MAHTERQTSEGNANTPWYLQADAHEQLEQRVKNGQVNESEKQLFTDLLNNGFCILRNAVPAEIIDQINADVDAVPENRDKVVVRRLAVYQPVTVTGLGHPNDRLLDFYVPSKATLEATLAPTITNILGKLYDEPPMAFQSLLFRYGSEQWIHQDTAYVVSEKPLHLTASWLALEDVQPGTGELCYYPGSHLQENQCYLDGETIWSRMKNHTLPNADFVRMLLEQCEKLGLEYQTFLPKKGDVLIWLAELAHGGSPITQPGATRQSYVTHYCPASDVPNYFKLNLQTSHREAYNNGYYTTRHYDIRPDSANPYPTFYGGENFVEIRDRTTPKKLANIFLPNFDSYTSRKMLAMFDESPEIYLTEKDMEKTFSKDWSAGLAETRDEFFENTQDITWRMVRGLFPADNHPEALIPYIKNSFAQATRIIIVLSDPAVRGCRHKLLNAITSKNNQADTGRDFIAPYAYTPVVTTLFEIFGKGRCLVLIEEEDFANNGQGAAEKLSRFLGVNSLDGSILAKPAGISDKQPDIPAEMLAQLREEHAETDITALEKLLGRKLDCWRKRSTPLKIA